MKNKKSSFTPLTVIPLIAVLLLGGCVTVFKKAIPRPAVSPGKEIIIPGVVRERPKVTEDVKVFRSLQEIDLDHDGKKEIVAIYETNTNARGVKVVRTVNDQAQIIFERIFFDPDVRFEVLNGVPKIIFTQSNKNGSKIRRCYTWDGKTFLLDPEE